MTDKLPPSNLPEDDNQATTPSAPHRTTPMRPVSPPENAAPARPPATPPARPAAPPPQQPAPRQPTRPMPPSTTGHVQRANPGTGKTQPNPTGQVRKTSQTTSVKPSQTQRVRQPRSVRDSGLYLPWWSLALMLIGVLAASFMIVALVVALGGSALAPTREPVIVIVTAPPTAFGATAPGTQAVQPAGSQVLTGENPPASLDLQGPTLPAVAITPTPIPISIGRMIMVMGVDADELNIRDKPGVIGSNIVARAREGSVFTVVEGPQQADGFTWWRIQDIQDPARAGWGVANFLRVVIEGQ